LTVEEPMSVSVSYSLGMLYTVTDWMYEDTVYVDGCSGTRCVTVDYDVSLTKTYTFTQTSGIPLATGTATNLKNPHVIYVNWAGSSGLPYVEFD
jgi:hypothetical protein